MMITIWTTLLLAEGLMAIIFSIVIYDGLSDVKCEYDIITVTLIVSAS
jgi:hypothetical protein